MSSIRRSIFGDFIFRLIIFTAIYFSAAFLFGVVFKGFTIRLLKFLLGRFYYDFTGIIVVLLFIAYAVMVILIIYFSMTKPIRYMELLADSIDKVFRKDDEMLMFPKELKELESKLNMIKYTTIRNEQLAKEAEQRKNDLVVYLAHDLKTPLTSIIGYLSLLQEAPEMPMEMRAKFTSIAVEKAYRLEQLINEFFDITRFNLQAMTLENSRINLSLMLLQMIDEFYPMLNEKGIAIVTHIDDNIMIYGDADKLARVFDNLLRNGVSYSYENTDLEVSASINEGNAVITFKNKGDEIPQQRLDNIFEKFFRLDAARGTRTGGAGLGLAIAKQIIDLHKGAISVTSSHECTEFRVVIPRQAGDDS